MLILRFHSAAFLKRTTSLISIRPTNNARPSFLYNHTHANEVSINLAFIKVHYANDNVRLNLALMTGTYPQANLAAEPSILRNVFEANAGVQITRSANLWIDAGVFPSHIGFETAVAKDNWTLTRSISAENSPYYESGAKISYSTPDNNWTISALLLNGLAANSATDWLFESMLGNASHLPTKPECAD